MGDWSDNLEYEQREYCGHFYDTDEDFHEEEEEETDDERKVRTHEKGLQRENGQGLVL